MRAWEQSTPGEKRFKVIAKGNAVLNQYTRQRHAGKHADPRKMLEETPSWQREYILIHKDCERIYQESGIVSFWSSMESHALDRNRMNEVDGHGCPPIVIWLTWWWPECNNRGKDRGKDCGMMKGKKCSFNEGIFCSYSKRTFSWTTSDL